MSPTTHPPQNNSVPHVRGNNIASDCTSKSAEEDGSDEEAAYSTRKVGKKLGLSTSKDGDAIKNGSLRTRGGTLKEERKKESLMQCWLVS